MKLKEIKPGMEIHCKNDEEKIALLEEAERLGYVWFATKTKPTDIFCDSNTIHFYDAGETIFSADYKHITHSDNIDSSTIEFSDLIIPELTAEEVVQWLSENYYDDEFKKVFGSDYSICRLTEIFTPDEIVARIAEWKADHEKKETEIETEWFWQGRIFEVLADGSHCQIKGDQGLYDTVYKRQESAEEYMADELKEYCRTHDGQFIATVNHICRVKEVE